MVFHGSTFCELLPQMGMEIFPVHSGVDTNGTQAAGPNLAGLDPAKRSVVQLRNGYVEDATRVNE